MQGSGSTAVPVGGGGAFVVTGRHGWLYWHLDDELDVRIQVSDGPDGLLPTAVLVRSRSGGAVNGTHLRQVHLGQLERALKRDSLKEAIRGAWSARGAHDFRPESSTPDQAALLAESTPAENAFAQSAILERGQRRRDDFFYDIMETLYLQASANTRNPAGEIAQMYNVPTTTVHRWLKEGRRRRKLREAELKERQRETLAEEAEIDEGLKKMGLTWDQYYDLYGHEGAEDPLGAWKDDRSEDSESPDGSGRRRSPRGPAALPE